MITAARQARGSLSGVLLPPTVLAPVEPFGRRAEVRWELALPRPPADRGWLAGPGLLIISRRGILVEEVVALAERAIGGHAIPEICWRLPPALPGLRLSGPGRPCVRRLCL